MILGYGIIAVPTGIVSAEYTSQNKKKTTLDDTSLDTNKPTCKKCYSEKHNDNAGFCYNCGHKLNHD